MKRINEYKNLFGVEKEIELKALKTTYRSMMKEWHPDKIQEGDAKREEAEVHSRKIIDGYHFLISIAPETKEANLVEYTEMISNAGITDFQHKGLVLSIEFSNGSIYEYFGVNKQIFQKMVNSDKVNRFAKRSIYPNYLYRKTMRSLEEA